MSTDREKSPDEGATEKKEELNDLAARPVSAEDAEQIRAGHLGNTDIQTLMSNFNEK